MIVKKLKLLYIWMVKINSKRKHDSFSKEIFLLSFPETSTHIIQKLYEKLDTRLIICYTNEGKELAEYFETKGCIIYNLNSIYILLKNVVPLLKQSNFVFCDNYFPFLAGIDFSDKTKVVQLWHANGAIKSFGLEAEYAKEATENDKKRYLDVYKKFTHYVVSSHKMATIFEKNYQQEIQELPFGYPSTDVFFDNEWVKNSRKIFSKKFPTKKKTLLYVPTYREREQENPIDFSKLQKALGNEWQIFAKAHPHDKKLKKKLEMEKCIITDFREMTLNQMYPSVDCLITDYSSVPFEYTLANPSGKIVFFCYDIKEYQESVGIESDFEKWAPGKIVVTIEDLIQAIREPAKQNFDSFNQLWNEYAKGKSAEQLIEWVDKQL